MSNVRWGELWLEIEDNENKPLLQLRMNITESTEDTVPAEKQLTISAKCSWVETMGIAKYFFRLYICLPQRMNYNYS